MKSKKSTSQKDKNTTMIFYYVPEDHDDPDMPNGFMYSVFFYFFK